MVGARDALLGVAPERGDQADLEPVTIRLLDSNEFLAAGHSGRREIVITRATAECLWLASIAFVSVADLVDEQLTSGLRTITFDFENDGRAAAARLTLLPAFVGVSNVIPINWSLIPEPRLEHITSGAPMVTRASEMARFAMAFVLRHELSHILQAHIGDATTDNRWTLDEEKDADSEAIDFIFGQCPDEAEVVSKRAWGIVIATAFSTGLWFWNARKARKLGLKAAAPERQTHPQPYDRLLKALAHKAVAENKLARETMAKLATASLAVLIAIFGIKVPVAPIEDLEAFCTLCLNLCADELMKGGASSDDKV